MRFSEIERILVAEFSPSQRKCWRVIEHAIWEKHNPARNASHADYTRADYVVNRIAVDQVWKEETENTWKEWYAHNRKHP